MLLRDHLLRDLSLHSFPWKDTGFFSNRKEYENRYFVGHLIEKQTNYNQKKKTIISSQI